ncbi:Calmodulin [Hondaea fermentalgiana]|uniref:Calmodulin n=1 Tax=Hondaea fermentalgiana TaxID=2315210 RepID=A0A2R5GT48_9STRA|nr:Calmodulin [Hondaea fermentalgiana]|eukprot:GBG31054.1 Calmodulin [Hondaea fermentalgiana]
MDSDEEAELASSKEEAVQAGDGYERQDAGGDETGKTGRPGNEGGQEANRANLVSGSPDSTEGKVDNDAGLAVKMGGGIEPRRPGLCKARAANACATVWWTDGSEAARRASATTSNDDEEGDTLYSKTHTYVVRKYRLDGNEWKYKGEAAEVEFPATSATIEPLANGWKYQFSVQAKTKKGVRSLESAKSEVVEPFEPLPEPWTEHFDKTNGQRYYYNPETHERTVVRPTENLYAVSDENKELFQRKEIAKLRLRFGEIDEDDSGRLDDGELAALFKELDIAITRPKIRRLIKLVDADGSGLVEFDEFLTIMHMLRNGYGDTLQDQLQKFVKGKAITDAAGAVLGKIKGKLGENARMERVHEQRVVAQRRMGDWVKKYDEVRRRDYYVNKKTLEKTFKIPDEVLWFVPEELAENFSEEQLFDFREQFERFDEDHSGEMDTDELTEAMRALGDEISHKTALALIKEVDVDNSGEICFAEFVQIMDSRRRQKRAFVEKVVNPGKEDKAKLRALKREVFEIKKENSTLRKEVVSLRKACHKTRAKKMVFVPVVPLKEFLAKANLVQYHDAMAAFGVRDTTDLIRLEEDDYLLEFGFKRGHMRKLLGMLTALNDPEAKRESPLSPP